MNKRVKIAIIVLVVILVALFAYNYYKKRKAAKEAEELANTNNNTSPVNTATTTVTKNDNFPLQRGSYGNNVRYLQQAINRLNPNANLSVDGDFGPSTYSQFLLTIGTTVNIDGVVYSAYPVTQKVFTEILQDANAQRSVQPELIAISNSEVIM